MSRHIIFKKYLLRIAGIVFTGYLLFAIASWVLIAAFDLQKQRSRIETLASQALARDVHIDGPISLKAALFPRISIENVRIANTDWADQPNFLTVEQLEVEISLLAILLDKLVIQDLELNGVTINLQRGPDQSANWVFKSETRQESTPGNIPEIIGFQASRVLIMFYPADKPPVAINIDEMQAALKRDEPVAISINATIRDIPLKIELQGGTLAEILDREARWPIKGMLDIDVRKIDFEGYITDLVTFKKIELQVSSEKQEAHDSLIFGRNYEPMLDSYQGELSITGNTDGHAIKLAVEANGFDLSQMYEPSQRLLKPSLKFRNLKITARSSGSTLSDIFQASTSEATATAIVFQYPVDTTGQHFYTARIDNAHAKTIEGKGVEIALTGSANDIAIQGNLSFNNLLYGIWQDKEVPLDIALQSSTAQARFSGNFSQALGKIRVDGKASMQADNLKTIGNLLAWNWPESAALQATGEVKFDDSILTLSSILGQLGTQKARGEISLSYGDALNLSIKAYADRFDLHDALPANKLPANFAFNLNELNLTIQGKNKSLMQCVLGGAWDISARQGQIGWRPDPAQTKYLYALRDLNLVMHDSTPITLSAQILHNQLKLNLGVQAGHLEELLDTSQPYPLNLQLSGEGLTGSFQGVLQKPVTDVAVVGDLDVNGQLSTIGQMLNLEYSKQQPAKLHAHIAIKHNDFQLTDVAATTTGVVFNGDLHYQDKISPHLVINSSGSSIDLATYLDKESWPVKNAAKQVSSRRYIVSDTPFDFNKYRSLDAVVSINKFGIKYEDADILVIDARLTADKGLLRLDPLEMRSAIDSSTTHATLELDSTSKPARASYSLQARNFDYGDLLRRFEITDEVTGTLDFHVDMNGKGNNLRDLMSSANGEIQLVANRGLVPKWLLEAWGSGLIRLVMSAAWMEEPVTDLNCAVGHFKLVDGNMQSQTLLADTRHVTIAGEVAVNWRDETIIGLFKPQPKEATLFHLGTPIQLSGTLAQPRVAPAESGFLRLGKWAIGLTSPAALIVVFGDIGAEEKNPCAALLKKNDPVQENDKLD